MRYCVCDGNHGFSSRVALRLPEVCYGPRVRILILLFIFYSRVFIHDILLKVYQSL